jgi:uncharacterized phage protein (TIGR01671 family)
MREIKFRAWDKLRKRWLTPSDTQPSFTLKTQEYKNGPLVDIEHFLMTLPLTVLVHEGKYPIKEGGDAYISMFTGLKDKNGKEIYEGDILSCPPQLIEVKWGRDGWYLPNEERVEIIGNIYENPELIK